MDAPIRCTVDGAPVEFDLDGQTPTLEALRDHADALACKQGCAPQGMCGCCAILVDGRPRLACTLPVRSLQGKAVQTARSVPGGEALAEAFAACAASACGYCTPGMLVSASALLAGAPDPSDEAIARALTLNLCRCTGYAPIVTAVKHAARVLRGEAPRADASDDQLALARGERPFVGDLQRPGMLHGAVSLAPASGRLSEVSLPDEEAGLHVVALRAAGDEVIEGEVVLAVAHADAARAKAAAGATLVTVVPSPAAERVLARARRIDGDVVTAFTEGVRHRARHVLRSTVTDTAPLEPEATLAVPTPAGMTVYTAGEDAWADAQTLEEQLGVQVRVVLVPAGGSLGGRGALSLQRAAARLAQLAERPVRIALSHEDSVRLRAKRPAMTVEVDLGADADGALVALDVAVRIDGGRHTHGADLMVAEALGAVPFTPPHLRVAGEVVTGDGPATAATRGALGAPVAACVHLALVSLAKETGRPLDMLLRGGGAPEATALLDALAMTPTAEGTMVTSTAVARTPGAGGARVVVTAEGDGTFEIQCNVPDIGAGRDAALLDGLARGSGLPASAFVVAWAQSDVVGAGALATADVRAAAQAAGEALRAAGGLDLPRGARRHAEDHAIATQGHAAARVELDTDGRVLAVRVVAARDEALAPEQAVTSACGGAALGAGLALTERLPRVEGAVDPRLKGLGVPKIRHSLPVLATTVTLPGGPREVTGAACAVTTAALLGALSVHEEAPRTALPARDSAPARQMGARPV